MAQKKLKCIMFDCMETLIDMTEIPTIEDYALWTYKGSGVEHFWKDYDEFLEDFWLSRKIVDDCKEPYQEFNIYERYEKFVIKKAGMENYNLQEILDSLISNYWKMYKSKCYVREDVKKMLLDINKKYNLGVVSNFIIPSGVEELLKQTDIDQYFNFVITSVGVGKRKPHNAIFRTAMKIANAKPEEIVFVGDDFKNDYIAPRKLGITSVIYDRNNKYTDNCLSISDLKNLPHLLGSMR